MPPPPHIERAEAFAARTAVIEPGGKTYSYAALLEDSARAAGCLLGERTDLDSARVAFLVPPCARYVTTQWAIWRAGGIAVPLATMHPSAELAHVIVDSDPDAIVADPTLADKVQAIARERGIRFVSTDEFPVSHTRPLPDVSPSRGAMIVYTSGSTGSPKGVLTTHENIGAQITSLVSAWAWSSDDRILLTLPLHHVHGIINVLGCSLWSGASCYMLPRFDAEAVWNVLVEQTPTLFMAVPTIYRRLAAYWSGADERDRAAMAAACRRLRLMVSGSAALPTSLFEQWKSISGHTLLERYGMTEIGMALGNPLEGPRKPGEVGIPLPNVDVKLVDENGNVPKAGEPGEIYVRGPTVFREYWRRPQETREAFEGDWFKTGDVAVVENGTFRILGRRNADIIKTGGYKVSALEIEEVLRTHPQIDECAVVGVADREWGEAVAVAVETNGTIDVTNIRDWARDRLAPYKIPSKALTVDALPRNAMGKVVKARVVELFQESS